MHITETTAARLLAIHQRAFDNAGCSRSVLPHRPRYGTALTLALFAAAAAALAAAYLI